MDYLAHKKILTELDSISKNPKELQTAFLVRFSKVLTQLCEVVSTGDTIQVPPPNMLVFHIVNSLRYACTDFVGILTDLQGNNYNAKAWYQPGNLGHTLNKAVAHNEALSNIFERVHKQETPNNPQNKNQNKHNQNYHKK